MLDQIGTMETARELQAEAITPARDGGLDQDAGSAHLPWQADRASRDDGPDLLTFCWPTRWTRCGPRYRPNYCIRVAIPRTRWFWWSFGRHERSATAL